MRADRLLSILMLLQARGSLNSGQLAVELEVSSRTIARDIDALSAAGVPVYSTPGRGGGYALLDSYRTTLTGLTRDETRALWMLTIPTPLQDLDVHQDLKAALRKLVAAMPGAGDDQARVQQRIHLDSTRWPCDDTPLPHLQILYDAVWSERRLLIRWQVLGGPADPVELVVDPYGLVAKANVWYLVYAFGGRVRVHPVEGLLAAEMRETHFERPADFDLAAFWREWCAGFVARRPRYPVRVRIAPHLRAQLAHYMPQAQAQPAEVGEWAVADVVFESFEAARDRLLALGGAVEVLEPLPLRLSIADYAYQIASRYREPSMGE